MSERVLDAAYAFTGNDSRVLRKIRALRRRFGAADVVRLGDVSGLEAVNACRELGFEPNRLVVADARSWDESDINQVVLYLLDPTPGTVLALWCEEVPRDLKAAVGETFYLPVTEQPDLLWPMIDAWGSRHRAVCINHLTAMMDAGQSPFMLLGVLVAQIRLVLRVKNYAANGMRARAVIDATGKTEWVVRKAYDQGRRRTTAQLAEYLLILANVDDRMKGGARTPIEFELTRAVSQLF